MAVPPAAVDTRVHLYPGNQGIPSLVLDYFPKFHFDNYIWKNEDSTVADLLQLMTKTQARTYEATNFDVLFSA